MAIFRFAYLKLRRPNQTTFSPSTAVTTYVETRDASISPLGAAGTTAPSTLLVDNVSKNIYYLNQSFSAVHAVMTAITSDTGQGFLI